MASDAAGHLSTPPLHQTPIPARVGKSSTSFKKGQSGNPGGRPKAVESLVELAREFTQLSVDTLVELVGDSKSNAAVRVSAAKELLDRGWGKAPQTSNVNVTTKRSALDWSTDELVATISERRVARERTPTKNGRNSEPDSVH
jgi:hypothetical protein